MSGRLPSGPMAGREDAMAGDKARRAVLFDIGGPIDLEGTFAPCRWFDFVGTMALPDVGRGFDNWATRMAVRVRF